MSLRRVPLQRRTELARSPLPPGRPLEARGGLRRTGGVPKPRAAQKTPQRRPTGPSRAIVETIVERDEGVCVVCGRPGTEWAPLVAHHRINRGFGGSKAPRTNLPSNLLIVCPLCNGWMEDAKGADRQRALDNGWKLLHGMDPAQVPVTYPDGSRWLLDDEGERRPV